MHVEAILTQDDVADVLRQFVPLEFELGKIGAAERIVAVDELRKVTLLPAEGVRVECTAHLRWPVLGIGVPVRIHELTIVLSPSVRIHMGEEFLVFKLKIEAADIAWVPARIDKSIAERVNRDLADHNVELAWNFHRALTHVFRLPDALRSAATLGLRVTGGKVTVTESTLGLSVTFGTEVKQRTHVAE